MTATRQDGDTIVMKYLQSCATLMTEVSSRIYGGSLDTPPGINEAKKYIAFVGDGAPGHQDIPMADERFTFHCYGASQLEARSVYNNLLDALHRAANKRPTISTGKTALIRSAMLVMGGQDLPDPGTNWPRVVCAFQIVYYEGTFSS
jgi:hypothetical protein